jgi:protocatechuate 3,4-dioxygenase beta subunit
MHLITTRTIASRRRFLAQMASAGAFFTVPGAFAEALTLTPRQTEGPFYPDHLPLDTDNDLIIINDSITSASGEVTYLSGRVLGPNGQAVRGATVEIWQCDINGAYIHSKTFGGKSRQDKNFQGYGRFLTSGNGEYLFRTIKPVPYSGRCPHIHAKVRVNGRELLTTQLYIKGHPQNDNDSVRRGIRDAKALESVTREFAQLPGAPSGVLAAKWDIVLGTTPADDESSRHEHTAPERERRGGRPGGPPSRDWNRPPPPPDGFRRERPPGPPPQQ